MSLGVRLGEFFDFVAHGGYHWARETENISRRLFIVPTFAVWNWWQGITIYIYDMYMENGYPRELIIRWNKILSYAINLNAV